MRFRRDSEKGSNPCKTIKVGFLSLAWKDEWDEQKTKCISGGISIVIQGEAAGLLVMCLKLGDYSGLLCRIVMTRLKEAWKSACQAETFEMPIRKWGALDVFFSRRLLE